MRTDTDELTAILSSTPNVLRELLSGLPESLTNSNEGGDTWSPYDVVGHLIHGEKTDWIPRAKIILGESSEKTFEPFDRFAQFEASKGKSLGELLDEFETLRNKNILQLASLDISEEDLGTTGVHPDLGTVTLGELLSTWAAHDLDHIAQISRTVAKQFEDRVGPWKKYIRVLQNT